MNKHSRITSNVFRLAVLALAMAGAGSAMAQESASTTATGVVVAPVKITKAVDLSFGTFAGGASTGTLTVRPDNSRDVTGGVVKMGGTPSAAKFDVEGQAGAGYSISVGGATELTSGTDTIGFVPISDFSASNITSGAVTTGLLSGSGTQSVYVGGILSVAINQPAGTYTGNVTATVQYN